MAVQYHLGNNATEVKYICFYKYLYDLKVELWLSQSSSIWII